MVTVTKYVWDPVFDCVTSELDENNAVKAVYHNEPQQYGGVLSQRRGTTSHYHHHDALGSTRFLTDTTGNVTDTYLHDAWGNQVASTGTTVNPFRWVGRYGYYQEGSTGLVYVRARMYQPTVARWIARPKSSFDAYQFVLASVLEFLGDEPQNPDNVVAVGGWFSMKGKDCAGQDYKNCCCSSFQVIFRPDAKQSGIYFSISLRVGVRTREEFDGIVCGFLSRDSGWIVDNPDNSLGGHTDWDHRVPTLPAQWDDFPGGGPASGASVPCCYGWPLCVLTSLIQEFEVCAIAIEKGPGAIVRNLGCIQYMHSCKGKVLSSIFGCFYSCNISRTPSMFKQTPGAQVHLEPGLMDPWTM